VTLQDFQDLFRFKEDLRKINGIEDTELYLGPPMPIYPLNLFQTLL